MGKWLTVRVGRVESKAAHLFQTTYTGPVSGAAVTACEVAPFSRLEAGEVLFAEPSPDKPRCEKCSEKGTASEDVG